MKKFFSLLLLIGLVNTVQARQLKIDCSMRPSEPMCMKFRRRDMIVEVQVTPCQRAVCPTTSMCHPNPCRNMEVPVEQCENGLVNVEIKVFQVTPEGEREMCRSCQVMELGTPVCMCMPHEKGFMPESMNIVVNCCLSNEVSMDVEFI